eukprot:165566-Chlamydomonas_euryale.AAC.7
MTQRDVTAAQACVLVNRREVARAFLSEARDDRGLAVALHASGHVQVVRARFLTGACFGGATGEHRCHDVEQLLLFLQTFVHAAYLLELCNLVLLENLSVCRQQQAGILLHHEGMHHSPNKCGLCLLDDVIAQHLVAVATTAGLVLITAAPSHTPVCPIWSQPRSVQSVDLLSSDMTAELLL